MRKKQIIEYLKVKKIATVRQISIDLDIKYNHVYTYLLELYLKGIAECVDVDELWPHARKPCRVRYWFLPENREIVKEFLERQPNIKIVRWYTHGDKIPSLY